VTVYKCTLIARRCLLLDTCQARALRRSLSVSSLPMAGRSPTTSPSAINMARTGGSSQDTAHPFTDPCTVRTDLCVMPCPYSIRLPSGDDPVSNHVHLHVKLPRLCSLAIGGMRTTPTPLQTVLSAGSSFILPMTRSSWARTLTRSGCSTSLTGCEWSSGVFGNVDTIQYSHLNTRCTGVWGVLMPQRRHVRGSCRCVAQPGNVRWRECRAIHAGA
jgi:hypothetical protein